MNEFFCRPLGPLLSAHFNTTVRSFFNHALVDYRLQLSVSLVTLTQMIGNVALMENLLRGIECKIHTAAIAS